MNVPRELRYSADHDWVRGGKGGGVRVGITDYAQDALGDVVFIDLPPVGTKVAPGAVFGEVESTKSVSELFAPLSGTVVAINDELEVAPERVNEDPYGDGWICEIELSDPAELDDLIDAASYSALIEG